MVRVMEFFHHLDIMSAMLHAGRARTLLICSMLATGACGWVMSRPDFSPDTSEDVMPEEADGQDPADPDGDPGDVEEDGDGPVDLRPDDAPLDPPADDAAAPDWPCRRTLEIDNTEGASTLEGFQVRVDVEREGAMNGDFSDIRFGSDGLGDRYAYWIEEIAGDGSQARVWVRVPSIAASAVTTLFMYYGNAGASDEGDPEAVFELYDDFESGTLEKWTGLPDVTPWSVTTELSRSGSHALSCTDFNADEVGHDFFLVADGIHLSDMVFEAAWHVTSIYLDVSQTFRSASSLPMETYEVNLENDHWVMAKIIAGEWRELAQVDVPPAVGSWFRLSTVMVGTSARVLIDDVQVVPASGWVNMGDEIASGSAGFKLYFISPDDTLTLDDARVRKAADPFPVPRWGVAECP
jgi:hypothetical protein